MKMKRILSYCLTIALLVSVAYFNFTLIRGQFEGDFGQNVGSIEISYIQMAKFWVEGGTSWQPLWYLGYPWHVFYTPLLPALEVVLHYFAGFSYGHAYRVLTALGYVLVPVATFLFVWQISKSRTGAFVAALFYTFVPSVIGLLFKEVAADSISSGLEPRRFTILVRWGEGPHTFALVFLPLFGLFLAKYFEKNRFRDLCLASVFLVLAALTNAIVVWAALLLAFAFLLAEVSKKGQDFIPVIKKIFKVGVLAFVLVSFWYNLPFLKTFFREGGGALGNWLALFPWWFLVLLFIGGAVFLVIRKFTVKFNGLSFALYWFLGFFLIVYIYYSSGEDQLEYVPQALRLNTEVDLSLGVLIGVIVSNIYLFLSTKIGKKAFLKPIIAVGVVALPAVLVLPTAQRLLADLPKLSLPVSSTIVGNIENIREKEIADDLKQIVGTSDQRVFVPGNYGFWLNYFEPIAQIRGALYQSSTHSLPEHIYWQITNGFDGQIALAWLKISNIGTLVYSRELYGDFKVPKDKFNGVLEEKAVNRHGDIYFHVPLKDDSLAKVVDYKELLSVPKPENAIDEKPIYRYVAVLEKNSNKKLKVEKLSRSRMRITGQLDSGQGVLVQQTYDSGWHASGWTVKKDNFDFVVLVPKKGVSGDFSVELVYRKPLSVYVGYLITIAGIGWVLSKLLGIKRPVLLTSLRNRKNPA